MFAIVNEGMRGRIGREGGVRSPYHSPARRCHLSSRRHCRIYAAEEHNRRHCSAFPSSDRIPSCVPAASVNRWTGLIAYRHRHIQGDSQRGERDAPHEVRDVAEVILIKGNARAGETLRTRSFYRANATVMNWGCNKDNDSQATSHRHGRSMDNVRDDNTLVVLYPEFFRRVAMSEHTEL